MNAFFRVTLVLQGAEDHLVNVVTLEHQDQEVHQGRLDRMEVQEILVPEVCVCCIE